MNQDMKSTSTLTVKRLSSAKWALLTGVILATVCDLLMLIAIAVGGYSGVHFIAPALLLGADVLFLLAVVFCNFRFRYTILFYLIYLAVAIGAILLCQGLSMGVWGSAHVATFLASLLFVCMHALTCVFVLVASLYSAHVQYGSSRVSAIALLFLLAGGAVYYGQFVWSEGFFGQDGGRPLVYTLNEETQEYEITGILEGTESTVVVPETFDGVKVGKIDCSIFTAEGVKEVRLGVPANVELKNIGVLKDLTEQTSPVVYIAKEQTDAFKEQLYSLREEWHAMGMGFALANHVYPSQLKEDEVFVSFSYDVGSYTRIKQTHGSLFPTWVGKKGDVFDFAYYASNYGAMAHTDPTNVEDLHWADTQNGGFMLKALQNERGQSIENTQINANVKGVTVAYEQVYRVNIGADNDSVYEPTDSMKSDAIASSNLGYRLLAESRVETLSTQFARNGFTLSWKRGGAKVENLLETVKEVGNGVTLSPQWELNAPTVTLQSNGTQNNFVYGDTVSLTANAIGASNALNYTYSYSFDGANGVSANVYLMGKAKPAQSGEHTVTVTASAEGTSLTAQTSAFVTLAIAKKALQLNWTVWADNVYSATDKSIGVSLSSKTPAVDSDNPTFTTSISSMRNAGSMTVTASLTSLSDCYQIASQSQKKTYQIIPKAITLSWSNLEVVYNGNTQKPTVTPNGLLNGEDAEITVTGAKNVGNYTATATIGNTNYSASENLKKQFTVSPKTITLSWEGLEVVYNGGDQKPTITPNGVVSGEDAEITVTGAKKAGVYTATATIGNANYACVDCAETFTILPKTVNLVWNDLTFTYDGYGHQPTATPDGVCAGETLVVAVSGEQTNAGENYSATASITDTNYTLDVATKQTSFTIRPQTVTVAWSNTSLEYNGSVQNPTATVKDEQGRNVPVNYSEGKVNANGAYTCVVTLQNTTNYTLENASVNFSIAKQTVEVVWTNTSLEYNGSVQNPTATVKDAQGRNVPVNYSAGERDAGNNYICTVTLVDGTNYTLTHASTNFSIAPKAVTLSWQNGAEEFVADGTEKTPTATCSEGGVLLTYSYQKAGGGVSATAPTEAGEYTVTVTVEDSNYEAEALIKTFQIIVEEAEA